jgi:hypothetical protein
MNETLHVDLYRTNVYTNQCKRILIRVDSAYYIPTKSKGTEKTLFLMLRDNPDLSKDDEISNTISRKS